MRSTKTDCLLFYIITCNYGDCHLSVGFKKRKTSYPLQPDFEHVLYNPLKQIKKRTLKIRTLLMKLINVLSI